MAAGCNGFLTKPIKMDQLIRAIHEYSRVAPEAIADNSESPAADEVNHLKSRFLRNRQGEVETLQTALAERNFDEIRMIGHRIKGLAGSYDLHAIGLIGSHLEQAAVAQEIEDVARYIHELRDAVMNARASPSPEPKQNQHAA